MIYLTDITVLQYSAFHGKDPEEAFRTRKYLRREDFYHYFYHSHYSDPGLGGTSCVGAASAILAASGSG